MSENTLARPVTGRPKFRKAFIAQNTGHNFSPVKAIADELVFVTTGYEDETSLSQTIQRSLRDFDPGEDLIVPVGNVYVNMLIGTQLSQMFSAHNKYAVALFREQTYHVRFVGLGEMINGNSTVV